MKVEIEILEDQLDLLNKIRALPAIIEGHLGKLPQAFPKDQFQDIRHYVANLEFRCKKMIFETCVMKDQLTKILDKTFLTSDDYNFDVF